jgi:uracil-DNA glycosylase
MTVSAFDELVAARKACRRCSGLANPSVIEEGRYDSDEIGPYARWQGNRESPLLVVGQDFADVDGFIRLEGWPGERVQTNRLLTDLLREAGFAAQPPRRGVPDDVAFCTNAVLCMKQGGMQASVPSTYFENCGRSFLRPTIELVAPRAVVALGAGAVTAIRAAYGVPKRATLTDLVEHTPAATLGPRTALFVRFHPSPRVTNSWRSEEAQREDWARIGDWLRASEPDVPPA